jgi:hypothetical protein
MPRRVYSSVESQAMVEADLDIRRLLGPARFEDEEGTENGEGGENAEQGTQQSQSAGESRAGSVAPSVSQTSTASTSRARQGSLLKTDVIRSYLSGRKQTEKLKIQVEARRLDREDREEERLERQMVLDEHCFRQEQQRQRAEIIATYIKAGLSLDAATKAYEDGKKEGEEISSNITRDVEAAKAALRTSRGKTGKGKERAINLDSDEEDASGSEDDDV